MPFNNQITVNQLKILVELVQADEPVHPTTVAERADVTPQFVGEQFNKHPNYIERVRAGRQVFHTLTDAGEDRADEILAGLYQRVNQLIVDDYGADGVERFREAFEHQFDLELDTAGPALDVSDKAVIEIMAYLMQSDLAQRVQEMDSGEVAAQMSEPAAADTVDSVEQAEELAEVDDLSQRTSDVRHWTDSRDGTFRESDVPFNRDQLDWLVEEGFVEAVIQTDEGGVYQ